MNKFEEMVQRLSKDGADILVSLTPGKCHAVHMVMGISGEVAELCQAVENADLENILEELGDLDFYMVGLCQAIPELQSGMMEVTNKCTFPIIAGEVLDLVKKYVMYDGELKIEKLQLAMNKLEFMFTETCNSLHADYESITRDSIREQNMKKLDKRYAEGYSDAAATLRADKA